MKKIIALLMALVMVLALCACGGSSAPAATAAPAQEAAPAAEAAPAEEAPAEISGSLTIYSPHDSDPLNDGVAQFEAAYPGVKVEVIADGTSNLVAKIAAESAAPIADVL